FSPDAPFLKAQLLDVSVKLLPLLQKQIEINSLTLQRPSINFIKNEAGVWNTASLGPPENIQGAKPQAEPKQPAGPKTAPPGPSQSPETSRGGQEYSLSSLTVQDGQISLLDKQKSKTPSLYDHIDITLEDLAPGTPFTIDVAAHMAGKGSQQIRLHGKGGPRLPGQPEATPVDGTLDLKQVAIADLAKFLNSQALEGTAGTITGQTKINNKSGKLTAQGEADVQNAKVRGMELGYPIRAQYDLTHDLEA